MSATEEDGSDDPRPIGTTLAGKYVLEAVLGRGGMGVVYRGRHALTERPVAVKVLYSAFARDEAFATRFVREAKAAAGLPHPNVVDVLDYGVEPDGTAYQVLELLEGESLRERLERGGPLTVERTLEIVLPLLHALDLAHKKDLVHRDLKPDNIFLARNAVGRVAPKLLDFGIAKVRTQTEAPSFKTTAGTVMGTPSYMSPEQASGSADVDERTDVWAMGMVIYECLSGRAAFTADTVQILLARIMLEDAPSLATVAPTVPREIVAVVDRALKRRPHERTGTVAELARDLRAAAAQANLRSSAEDMSDYRPSTRPAGNEQATRVGVHRNPAMEHDETVAHTPRALGTASPARREESESVIRVPETSRAPIVIAAIVGVLLLGGIAVYASSGSGGEATPRPTDAIGAQQGAAGHAGDPQNVATVTASPSPTRAIAAPSPSPSAAASPVMPTASPQPAESALPASVNGAAATSFDRTAAPRGTKRRPQSRAHGAAGTSEGARGSSSAASQLPALSNW